MAVCILSLHPRGLQVGTAIPSSALPGCSLLIYMDLDSPPLISFTPTPHCSTLLCLATISAKLGPSSTLSRWHETKAFLSSFLFILYVVSGRSSSLYFSPVLYARLRLGSHYTLFYWGSARLRLSTLLASSPLLSSSLLSCPCLCYFGDPVCLLIFSLSLLVLPYNLSLS